jgi:hypothetical protein
VKYLPEYHIIRNKFSVIIYPCGSTLIMESITEMKCKWSRSGRMCLIVRGMNMKPLRLKAV